MYNTKFKDLSPIMGGYDDVHFEEIEDRISGIITSINELDDKDWVIVRKSTERKVTKLGT